MGIKRSFRDSSPFTFSVSPTLQAAACTVELEDHRPVGALKSKSRELT